MSSRVSDLWLKAAASTRAHGKSHSAPVIINSFSSETQLDTLEVEKTPTVCFLQPPTTYFCLLRFVSQINLTVQPATYARQEFACRYPEGLIRTQIRLQRRASSSVQPLVSLPVHWGWPARRRSISGTAPLSPGANTWAGGDSVQGAQAKGKVFFCFKVNNSVVGSLCSAGRREEGRSQRLW